MISAGRREYVESYYSSLGGFSQRTETELTILLYHGVTEAKSNGIENYSLKHVPLADFERDMDYLKQHCNVLSMDEVLKLTISEDHFPSRSVAVTFDDGFANNFQLAMPILNRLNIPATFYVTSGIVDTDLMFWVDQLEDCLNRTKNSEIQITLEGKNKHFYLNKQEERLNALDAIKTVCKCVLVTEKDQIVNQVIEKTGIEPQTSAAENYKKITWESLRKMASNPLFTIGGHSLYHDILALQNSEFVESDIETSIALLRSNLSSQITHYSYPEGQPNHYNDDIIKFLKKCGITCCPSAVCGLNPLGMDPFHLRRVMVGLYGIPMPFLDPLLA